MLQLAEYEPQDTDTALWFLSKLSHLPVSRMLYFVIYPMITSAHGSGKVVSVVGGIIFKAN